MNSTIFALLVVLAVVCYVHQVFAQEEDGQADSRPSILLDSALRGDIDGIKTAIDQGEGIDLVNDKGWSAARFAVATSDLNFLRALIEAGIDLNNADNEGVSPLMAAAEAGDRESVEILLAGNADPLQTALDGSDAYIHAQRSGRNVVALLIAEAGAISAITNDNLQGALTCLRRGSYANIRNSAGWTTLILATSHGDLEAVKEVLAAGADPNRTENDGWTALHFAADGGFDKIVDALLGAGADGTIRNVQGSTPRDLAMSHNFLTIVEKIPEPPSEL